MPPRSSHSEGAAELFAPLPLGRFTTIVADPPWDYSAKLSSGGTSGYSPVHPSRGGNRGAANHYQTLSLSELRELDIRETAAEQSHLYLWTTGAFVADAYALAEDWGFQPKGLIPWIKTRRDAPRFVGDAGDMRAGVRMGMGLYIRWCSEFVVFAVRGKLPTLRNDALGIIFAERSRHSAKPDEFYEFVRELSPGPRLDVFAREAHDGFVPWGNELPSSS